MSVMVRIRSTVVMIRVKVKKRVKMSKGLAEPKKSMNQCLNPNNIIKNHPPLKWGRLLPQPKCHFNSTFFHSFSNLKWR